jgi:hypothetical protein
MLAWSDHSATAHRRAAAPIQAKPAPSTSYPVKYADADRVGLCCREGTFELAVGNRGG